MKKKIKSEAMWAIWNKDFGFYVDTSFSRKEMIGKHTHDMNMTWDECKKVGDKVVRVLVTPIQPRRKRKA